MEQPDVLAEGALTMPHGYIALVLHAHLPFVRHPEAPHFLEEEWFFEAITETYAPLLIGFERLMAEDIDFRLTPGHAQGRASRPSPARRRAPIAERVHGLDAPFRREW